MASTPVDGIGLVSCDVFLVRGACACILVDGTRSHLWRAVRCRLIGFGVSMGSVCLWVVVLAFRVLGTSISAAASKWLSQQNCSATSPLLVLGNHCRCFCSSVLPCAAGRNLLGRCLCVSFCVAATCVGFPQPPKLTLCVAGLCTPVSAPWAGLCRRGLVWTCFGSLCPPSALRGLCALVSSRCLHS